MILKFKNKSNTVSSYNTAKGIVVFIIDSICFCDICILFQIANIVGPIIMSAARCFEAFSDAIFWYDRYVRNIIVGKITTYGPAISSFFIPFY